MQDLGTFGGAASEALDINNAAQVVGVAQASDGTSHGFLYSGNGPMIDLGAYKAWRINDSSKIVAFTGVWPSTQTFVSTGGTGGWTNIGSLGGAGAEPGGMNNLGDIVGDSLLSGTGGADHAFLYSYSAGTMTDLGSFGGTISEANGINDLGVVVGGASYPGNSVGHAFVYYGSGDIQDLDYLVDQSLGWTIDNAFGVNDQGQIAAVGYQQGMPEHAVLLTPLPEPTTSTMLLVGRGFLVRYKPWRAFVVAGDFLSQNFSVFHDTFREGSDNVYSSMDD